MSADNQQERREYKLYNLKYGYDLIETLVPGLDEKDAESYFLESTGKNLRENHGVNDIYIDSIKEVKIKGFKITLDKILESSENIR